MIKKILAGVLLFVVAWSVFAVATLPATLLWQRFPELNHHLARVGLSIQGVEGTLWSGRALLRYQQVQGLLDWHLQPSGLLQLQLPLALRLESELGDVNAAVALGVSQQRLRIERAQVDLARLTPLLQAQRVRLSGDLMLADVEFQLQDQVIDYVSGQVSWSGGPIAYPVGRQVRERTLPPFQGLLTMKDQTAHFGLREAGGRFDVIEATLNPQGEALASVKGRLFELVQEPLPGNYGEQDNVVKVKHKLLPVEF